LVTQSAISVRTRPANRKVGRVFYRFAKDIHYQMDTPIETSATLREVKYEICGQLASRADELEKRGYEIISLNIGNPGLFGYQSRQCVIDRVASSPYLSMEKPMGAMYAFIKLDDRIDALLEPIV
jgi:hypothetical protein